MNVAKAHGIIAIRSASTIMAATHVPARLDLYTGMNNVKVIGYIDT
jgi:hypothetical protein